MADDSGLKELADRLPALAEEYGLRLVPLIPESDRSTTATGDEAMTPEQLCDAARACGARVLFHHMVRFDAEEALDELDLLLGDDDEDEPPAVPPELDDLRRRLQRRDGQTEAVELCVVLDSIPVLWTRTAPWSRELLAEVDELQEQSRTRDSEARTVRVQETHEEGVRIARQLCEDPAFRAAATATARRRVAEHLFPMPGPDESEGRHAHWRGIAQALADVEAASHTAYNALKNQLGDLADELLATGVFDDARTAQIRKIRAKEFLQHRSGGYAPPADFLALLLEQPQLRRPAGSRPSLPAGRSEPTLFAADLPAQPVG